MSNRLPEEDECEGARPRSGSRQTELGAPDTSRREAHDLMTLPIGGLAMICRVTCCEDPE
jgi:hypothetical protein